MTKKHKQPHEKHVPMRMCIVTRERKPKAELIRVVRLEDGTVQVDPKGKLKGRGANMTMDLDVFDQSVRKHILEHALKLERKLTEAEVVKLRNEFEQGIAEKQFRRGNRNVILRVKKSGDKELVDN